MVSVARGNVGEHVAMAELLFRGFDAYWADRGNPKYDVACFWDLTNRGTRLRIKTTSNHSAVWTVKKSGLFLDVMDQDDFVLIVDLGAGLRERDIYIIPTPFLEKVLEDDHAHYVSQPKKDGSARKQEQGMRCIRFFGEEKTTDRSWGYDKKFAKYRESWSQLQ